MVLQQDLQRRQTFHSDVNRDGNLQGDETIWPSLGGIKPTTQGINMPQPKETRIGY